MSEEANYAQLQEQNIAGKIISQLSWYKRDVAKRALRRVTEHFDPAAEQLQLDLGLYSRSDEDAEAAKPYERT